MKRAKTIIAGICRTLLGVVFIFSGVVKAIDPLGTVYKIEDYLKAFGGFFSELLPWATVAAVGMIALELVLGVCMVLNVRTRWTSWIALLFYLVMTPLTLYVAINNPVSDCGCFGDAVVISNWQTFYKNVILLTMVVILVAWRKHIHPLWSEMMELTFVVLTLAIAGGLMGYTYTHLPIMDFRPYKIGNHIPTFMEYPEDAEADQYEISLVYAKDGIEQTFTLEDYPKFDSTWIYVRTDSKLIKKGYEPPIHDFEIINAYGEDITWDILESEEPVTLVIMYDLGKADKKQMAKVEALLSDETMGYILTGSGTDEIIALSLEHPTLSESICTCDPVTLKTIVRANPGVVVVQNGIIIDKYNIKNR
jgi:uncharacterized membrane protein YphA (DoxX/SURF4 family)